ncbi:MAG: glycosyltransferase [Clostridiaceae bacterium]|nr:glycosyltransferase [Clostridiaceae bacterium]
MQIHSFSGGKAARRLHKSFLEEGVDSQVLSLVGDLDDDACMMNSGKKAWIKARIDYKIESCILRNTIKDLGKFSFPVLGTDISKFESVYKADIIYLNWVLGGFMNLQGYRNLAKTGKPVVIVMHDMWTITGGCHHSFSCDKYTSECFKCPMFNGRNLFDLAARGYRKKLKLYTEFENLYFVSPSKWLHDCAKKSSLTRHKPVFHIPNIVDESVFKPLNKEAARQFLNINSEEYVIAFGALSLSNPYKGWKELEKALDILSKGKYHRNLSVLIFGGGYNQKLANSIRLKTIFLGYLKDEYSMALAYNAADVFVVPSKADNLPTTILECLSCGTPVTGFDVGGIPEMIDHMNNGYLASGNDPEDLAKGIEFCLANKLRGRLLPDFHKDVILKKHMDLLNNISK